MEVAKSNRTNIVGRTKSLKRKASPFRTSGKNANEAARQRSFLTTKFNAIPIFDVDESKLKHFDIEDGVYFVLGGQKIEIDKNLQYLRECAEAYCKVYGGHVPPKHTHPLKELQLLYSSVADCCPKNNLIEINYDDEMNRLVFVELAYSHYPECSLAFFSVKFLEYLPTEYRKFFLQVLSLARVTIGIPFPEDHFDFAYATGYLDEEHYQDITQEDPEYKEFVDSYVRGKAHEIFEEIYHSPWMELDRKEPAVYEYVNRLIDNAPSSELSEFVEVAVEGIELMSRQTIMKFRFNVGQCNIPEFDNVYDDMDMFAIDRVFAFCYGEEKDDPVVESAIRGINTEAGNLCQEELYEPCVITPEYSSPFIPSDFPERVFEWYIKFNSAQQKYEQTHKNDVADVQS